MYKNTVLVKPNIRANITVVAGDMKMGLAGKVVAAKAVKGRRDDKKDAKEEKKEEKK